MFRSPQRRPFVFVAGRGRRLKQLCRSFLRRRLSTGLALAVAGVGLASLALPQVADAFYRASAATTVNLRACPSTCGKPLQTVGPGTPLDIQCQISSQPIFTNSYWDQLTGGQWVADYYVAGTNIGRSPWIIICPGWGQ
jgi:uncharacterized protein YraI